VGGDKDTASYVATTAHVTTQTLPGAQYSVAYQLVTTRIQTIAQCSVRG
jgi:hypothetical protein